MTHREHADPRCVRHNAPPGLPDAALLPTRPHAVVVGAGIAGLAAATGLAERGVNVDVVEREGHLGGRAGGWIDHLADGTPVAMNRGFHAFFRQYYNLRELLRRTDPELRFLTPLDDYPLVDAYGRRDSFRGLPRTPPWNALAFVLRSPTFGVRDLLRIDRRAAAPLAAVSVPDIYHRLDQVDAETFLERINFPAAARHLAFEVFSRSFFIEPAHMSAAELATMFHIYFLGSSEGLLFDVSDTNFDGLWLPLREYLTSGRGRPRTGTVRFHTGVDIATIDTTTGAPFRLFDTTGAGVDADAVVLATDVHTLGRIVSASPTLGDPAWRRRIGRLDTAPAFLVQRLWLDRPVREDRPAFVGTGSLRPLDNISVVDRYERQAREWAHCHGGSVVELHAYALPASATVDPGRAELRQQMLARLHSLYPETADARILGERLLYRRDCPRLGPGDFAERPTVATPHRGLVLAGDGIRIDLPVALMERAATTGWSAANHLLARWGLSGHDLYTVPIRGRSTLLRRLAIRESRMP
ncbi:FAD-dependent oxidoreductase [Rhodococcus sp. CH91]|uniref:FAD-dependent oxidoreductase n=1 Tax=Rhodococcus sp. CH91 TaxID=2910256 RepID=UPI001F4AC609|nr:FAD-dependent oxidoreductase [Rhodococcus sp. CH91]